MMDVQVPCRKCGKKAPSSEFTIDNDLKIAICKACANERKISKSTSGFNPSVRNVPHELPKAEPRPVVLNQPGVFNKTGSSQSSLGINLKPSNRPAGWDETDELIEKAAASKMVARSSTGTATLEDGRIMHACRKCKYQFKYDPEDNRPNKCPYCGTATKDAFRS